MAENVKSFDDITKTAFFLKIPKIHTLPDSIGNHLNWVCWIITEFSMEMPETSGHVTGVFKTFEILFEGQKMLFLGTTLLSPTYILLL